MEKFIKVEELEKAISQPSMFDINKDDVVALIAEVAASNAVEVVHCSECAHSRVLDSNIPCFVCAKWGGQKVDYDGYCYKGERAVVKHG